MAEGGTATIGTLELQVQSDASRAAGGLTRLANSLGRIKELVSGGMQLGAFGNQLGMFAQQIARIGSQENVASIHRLSEAITELATSAKGLSGTGSALRTVERIAGKVGEGLNGGKGGTQAGSVSDIAGSVPKIESLPDSFASAKQEAEKVTENLADASNKAKEAQQSVIGVANAMKEAAKTEISVAPYKQTLHPKSPEEIAGMRRDIMNRTEPLDSGRIGAYGALRDAGDKAAMAAEKSAPKFAGAAKSAEGYAESIGHVEKAARPANTALETTAENAEAIGRAYASANGKLGMLLQKASGLYEKLGKGILSGDMSKLDMAKTGLAASSTGDAIAKLERQSAELRISADNAKSLGDAFVTANGKIGLLVMKAEALRERLGRGIASGTMDQKTMASLGSQIESIVQKIEKMKQPAREVKKETEGIATTFKKIGKSIFDANSGLLGFLHGMARMAKYRLFRSLIRNITEGFTTGLSNLREYSKAVDNLFHKDITGLDNSLFKMKNSLGAVLGSIIQSLIPLFQQLSQWVITAANYVNQFVALLSGRTSWTRAVDAVASDFEKTKDNAAGAAKETKNLLASWDELNIIQSKNNGGGSGSGNDIKGDYADLFEETVEFDNVVVNAVEWLRTHMKEVEIIVDAIIAKMLGFQGWVIPLGLGLYFSFKEGEKQGIEGGDFLTSLQENLEGFILSAVGGFLMGFWTTRTFSGALIGVTFGMAVSLLAYEIGWIKGDYDTNGKESFLAEMPQYIGNIVGTALAGAIIGWWYGGTKGAVIGFTVGASIGIMASILNWQASDHTAFSAETFQEAVKSNIEGIIMGGMAGAFIGIKFTHSFTGALVGFTVGAGVALGLTYLGWAIGQREDTGLSLGDEFLADAVNIIGPIVAAGLAGFTIGHFAGRPMAGALIGITIGAAIGIAIHSVNFDKDNSALAPEATFKDALGQNLSGILGFSIGGGILGANFLGGVAGGLIGILVGATVGIVATKVQYDAIRSKKHLEDLNAGGVTLTEQEVKDLVGDYFTAGADLYLEVTGAHIKDTVLGRIRLLKAFNELSSAYTVAVTLGWDKTSPEYVEKLKGLAETVVSELTTSLEQTKVGIGMMLTYDTTSKETGNLLTQSLEDITGLQGHITELGENIGKILADGVVDEFEARTLKGLMEALSGITIAMTTGQKAGEQVAKVQQLGAGYEKEGWTTETWEQFTTEYKTMKASLWETANEEAATMKGQLQALASGMEAANEAAREYGRDLPFTDAEVKAAKARAEAYDPVVEAKKIYDKYVAAGEAVYQEFQSKLSADFLGKGLASSYMDIGETAITGFNNEYQDFGILNFGKPFRNWIDNTFRKSGTMKDSLATIGHTLRSIEQKALELEKIEEVDEKIGELGPGRNEWNWLGYDSKKAIYDAYAKEGLGIDFATVIAETYGDIIPFLEEFGYTAENVFAFANYIPRMSKSDLEMLKEVFAQNGNMKDFYKGYGISTGNWNMMYEDILFGSAQKRIIGMSSEDISALADSLMSLAKKGDYASILTELGVGDYKELFEYAAANNAEEATTALVWAIISMLDSSAKETWWKNKQGDATERDVLEAIGSKQSSYSRYRIIDAGNGNYVLGYDYDMDSAVVNHNQFNEEVMRRVGMTFADILGEIEKTNPSDLYDLIVQWRDLGILEWANEYDSDTTTPWINRASMSSPKAGGPGSYEIIAEDSQVSVPADAVYVTPAHDLTPVSPPGAPSYDEPGGEDDNGASKENQEQILNRMRDILTALDQIYRKEFNAVLVPSVGTGQVVSESLAMYDRTNG